VRGGTVFQDTHLPVQTRFRAVWRICANQNGMSARNLQRLLGIGSYGTAWLCLHKLRRAMVGPGRDRLAGTVEADECYLGGPGEGKRGRGASGRQSVFVAAELRGHKIGRIRLSGLPDVSGATLDKAVSGAAGGGASVRTDGWKGCNGIGKPGYRREISVPADAGLADIVLPKRHLVASLLKRWTLGTLPGNIGADHVQDYLNEFTFRFNRRSSKSRGLLFYRLAELSVATGPAPRALIVPPKGAG
jgi:transposase-like protein